MSHIILNDYCNPQIQILHKISEWKQVYWFYNIAKEIFLNDDKNFPNLKMYVVFLTFWFFSFFMDKLLLVNNFLFNKDASGLYSILITSSTQFAQ